MSSIEFSKRRQKIIDKMSDNSVMIIYAGVEKIRTADDYYPFSVNRNFYYLTGINQDNSVLILVKTSGEQKEFLFIDEFNELKEKWTGKRLTSDEATLTSGIKNILFTNSLLVKLDEIVDKDKFLYGEVSTAYFDLSEEIKIGDELYTKNYARNFSKSYKHLNIIDCFEMIVELRMVKSKFEIEQLKEAIKITDNALIQLMSSIKPGRREYDLANSFELYVKSHGQRTLAFQTIVATGENAACLHYTELNSVIDDNQLILVDLGASYNLYCSDVSRTFPSSKVYSDLQRKIYQIVLDCNKLVISYVEPGKTLDELQKIAKEYLTGECLRHKLIEKEEDIINHYFHGVSHHLGLNTHDACIRSKPLEVNNVITVEPGLYFKELGIGVRIEDDIVVTETGCEVLTKDILKEVQDIEKLLGTAR